MLHIILHLHALQLNGDIFKLINISLLASSSLQASLSGDDAADAAMANPTDFPELRWQKLVFATDDPRSNIHFRHCSTLQQAMQGVPVRIVYMDSLIWLQGLGNIQEIKQHLTLALESDAARRQPPVPPAVVLPKPKWEELVEDKPQVYENLKDNMLPTVWFELSQEDIAAIRSKEIAVTAPAAAAAAAGAAAAAAEAAAAAAAAPAAAAATGAAAAGAAAAGAAAASAAASSPSTAAAVTSTSSQALDHYKKSASAEAKKAVEALCMKMLAHCKAKAKYFIKGQPLHVMISRRMQRSAAMSCQHALTVWFCGDVWLCR